MNDARTVRQRNIRIACHIERLFILLFADFHRKVKQRLIFLVFQILSRTGQKHLICRRAGLLVGKRAEHRI